MPERIYTCLPIQRFRVGGFQFQRGQLRLTDKAQIERFEKVLAGMSPAERQKIRTVSPEAAAKLVAQHQRRSAFSGMASSEALRASTRPEVTQLQIAEDLRRMGIDPERAAQQAAAADPEDPATHMPVESVNFKEALTKSK